MPCSGCGHELTTAGCVHCVNISPPKWGCVEHPLPRDPATVERERIVGIVKAVRAMIYRSDKPRGDGWEEACDENLRRIG